MQLANTDEPTEQKLLRLWPGVAIVVLQWLGRFVVPVFVPDALFYGVMGALAAGLAIVIWWVFFSRAPWSERLGAIALMVVAVVGTPYFLDESVATGNIGMMFPIYVIPVLSLFFVVWAVSSRRLATGTPVGDDGRGHPARLRVVHPRPDGRQYHRPATRLRVAVDQDARGAAPGTGRQRDDGAAAGAGGNRDRSR